MHYSPALDGIRAVAALAVVAFHAKVPGSGGGFLGVDVFFVLSGYLITRLLREEYATTGTIGLSRFYWRRLRRLYPALLLLLLAYAALAPMLLPRLSTSQHMQDAVIAALYLTDYSRWFGLPTDILSHTWSLAVEEQFYLLWPLLLLRLVRLPDRQAIIWLACAYLGATVWRLLNVHSGIEPRVVYDRFDTHSTGLILGCLIGYAKLQLHQIWGVAAAAILALCISYFRFLAADTMTYGVTAAELAAAVLVVAEPVWLTGTILPWIGRMSYGLYLWHYPVMRWCRDQFWGWPETLLVGLGVGLGMAYLSYQLLEKRLRARSMPSTPLLSADKPSR